MVNVTKVLTEHVDVLIYWLNVYSEKNTPTYFKTSGEEHNLIFYIIAKIQIWSKTLTTIVKTQTNADA